MKLSRKIMDWKKDLPYRICLSTYMIIIYAVMASMMRSYCSSPPSA